MLRTSFLMVALVAVFMFSVEARAAEPNGNVDQSALAAMGLGDLQVMSDTEGKEVRGTWATASGGGYALYNGNTAFGNVGGSYYETSYSAGDFGPGPDFAIGAGGNAAGVAFQGFNITVFSFGGSFGFAGP